jgi:hypothetical protein
MAALAAIRHNRILKAFYQQLRARGKPAKAPYLSAVALAKAEPPSCANSSSS